MLPANTGWSSKRWLMISPWMALQLSALVPMQPAPTLRAKVAALPVAIAAVAVVATTVAVAPAAIVVAVAAVMIAVAVAAVTMTAAKS